MTQHFRNLILLFVTAPVAAFMIHLGITVDMQPLYQYPADGVQDYRAFLERADQLYHHGVYDQAEKNYRFSRELDRRLRSNPVLDFKIGFCCFQKHEYREAAGHFRRTTELPALREYGTYYLAASLAMIPDSTAGAISEMKQFISDYPQSVLIVDARIDYIKLLLGHTNPLEAERQVNAAQSTIQSNYNQRRLYEPLLTLLRGDISLSQGKYKKAVNYYRLVQSNYRYCDEAYEAKNRIESIHRQLERHLPIDQFIDGINILILHGRYNEALSEIQSRQWQYPKDQQPQIEFQIARIAYAKGRYYDASIKFERLWKNHRHKESLYQLSRTARYDHNLQLSNQSLQDYLDHVAKTPAWKQYIFFEMANNYAAMGDSLNRRRAIGLYCQVKQKATLTSLYGYSSAFQEAFNYYKYGRYDSAITQWTRLSEQVPSIRTRCQFWTAKCYEKKGMTDSARAVFTRLSDLRMRDYYGMLSYTLHLDSNRITPHRLFYITDVPLLNEPTVNEWRIRNEQKVVVSADQQLFIPEFMNGDSIQDQIKKTRLIRDVLSSQAGERELDVYHNLYYTDFYKTLFVKRLAEDLNCNNIAVAANVALRSGFSDRFPNEQDLHRLMYPVYYMPIISLQQTQYPLDAALVLAVIKAESAFRSNAISPARAVGLMQIMPFTGREIAGQLDLQDFKMLDLQNPSMSIRMGMHYLNTQARSFNAYIPAILSAYNAGPHRAKFWMNFYNEQDPEEFPEIVDLQETGNYIRRIMLDRWVYSQLYSP